MAARPAKEARARIKINRLLEAAGWRFFDEAGGRANIALEPNVKITQTKINDLGENFDQATNGFVDFLLLDDKGFPAVVLEAKAADKNPLTGKEQARTYARSLDCRFVILSNGDLHYFWDLDQGNPRLITQFPTPGAIPQYKSFQPDAARLASEPMERDYIALTQLPNYANEAGWKNPDEREGFIAKNNLRFLREYQLRAVQALQSAVSAGKDRFLFEMATGTGKTLTSAAIIKLFLRTSNARRVLFLVDRLELEAQAQKAFNEQLKNDYKSVVYKEQRDDWNKAEIVVTTVQSLMFDSKYKTLFAPTDFDLVISDEAHRSISGDARAVFEYFVGYKLGLTATPKDYLRRYDPNKLGANGITSDPREAERRQLLDTYRAFGCESGEPTFRYTLLDGVEDGFLINPIVIDARTGITARLISEKGYAVAAALNPNAGTSDADGGGANGADANGTDAGGRDAEAVFVHRDFEKSFFSEPTNRVLCETFLQNALRDPISGEIGKSLVFAVSQNHAAKLTQILNEIADRMFPGKYQSDFAVQVTSQIANAQQYTGNFTYNKLMGYANFLDDYKTSKARVCVTVGMMTTGYDCPDLLNLALMRPVFSPSEFVQIKGRGTRTHDFLKELQDVGLRDSIGAGNAAKTRYKLFDFFGNCEYYEEKFDYDEIIKLPALPSARPSGDPLPPVPKLPGYENASPDPLTQFREQQIGYEGMKIDRMLYQQFEATVTANADLQTLVDEDRWEQAVDYVTANVLDKPTEFYTLEKLRKALDIDRRLGLREILEKAFGRIARFKSKDELLEDEFSKFVTANSGDIAAQAERLDVLRYYFKAYITDGQLRQIVDSRQLTRLNTNPNFSIADYKAVPDAWRARIPEYIKDYVPLNTYA